MAGLIKQLIAVTADLMTILLTIAPIRDLINHLKA